MQKSEQNMQITVNGQVMSFAGGTLESLLGHLGLDQKAVVAEINGVIVAQADFSGQKLRDGDIVELVRFVGGG